MVSSFVITLITLESLVGIFHFYMEKVVVVVVVVMFYIIYERKEKRLKQEALVSFELYIS